MVSKPARDGKMLSCGQRFTGRKAALSTISSIRSMEKVPNRLEVTVVVRSAPIAIFSDQELRGYLQTDWS